MVEGRMIEEPARVLFHLNGYTKVILERTEGVGLADGKIEWDIPTEIIPRHLRGIGSRFLVISASSNSRNIEIRLALPATYYRIDSMRLGDVLPPCLYLLWPRRKRDVPDARVPVEYTLCTYDERDERGLLNLQGSDGESMSETEWHHYRDMLLPNGLFLVEAVPSAELVATAGAVHNPNPGRYYFPFGGELGYLIVAPEHRGRGLGGAVCAAVIGRFLSAGYENIRVCLQEHRLAAIRVYLRLGFVPFLHSTQVASRWQQVFETIGFPYTPDQWPRQL